jgi:hypothetical protein
MFYCHQAHESVGMLCNIAVTTAAEAAHVRLGWLHCCCVSTVYGPAMALPSKVAACLPIEITSWSGLGLLLALVMQPPDVVLVRAAPPTIS